MKYEPLTPISSSEFEFALNSNDAELVAMALLRASFHGDFVEQVEDECYAILDSIQSDPKSFYAAILSLSHLARHRAIKDILKARQALESVRAKGVLVGSVDDALNDIAVFQRRSCRRMKPQKGGTRALSTKRAIKMAQRTSKGMKVIDGRIFVDGTMLPRITRVRGALPTGTGDIVVVFDADRKKAHQTRNLVVVDSKGRILWRAPEPSQVYAKGNCYLYFQKHRGKILIRDFCEAAYLIDLKARCLRPMGRAWW